MTKEEFRERWGGPTDPSDLTYEDVAACAVEWGVVSQPKIMRMEWVLYKVLKAAEMWNVERYRPLMDEMDEDEEV